MFSAREGFAVSLLGDSTGSRSNRLVKRSIGPERADRLGPSLALLLTREPGHVAGHPPMEGQNPSAATRAETAANNLRQRSAIADERRNRINHCFGRHSPEGLLPHRG